MEPSEDGETVGEALDRVFVEAVKKARAPRSPESRKLQAALCSILGIPATSSDLEFAKAMLDLEKNLSSKMGLPMSMVIRP